MRILEVGLALVLAVIAFVVFKLIGLVFKFALIAALAGLIVGLCHWPGAAPPAS